MRITVGWQRRLSPHTPVCPAKNLIPFRKLGDIICSKTLSGADCVLFGWSVSWKSWKYRHLRSDLHPCRRKCFYLKMIRAAMQILVGVLHKTQNTPPTSVGPTPSPVSSVGQQSHTLSAASNEWGDLTHWWMGWINFSRTLLLTCTKLDSGKKKLQERRSLSQLLTESSRGILRVAWKRWCAELGASTQGKNGVAFVFFFFCD